MLQFLRSLTRSWIAYVLLFLLVVAFAVWGIDDVFRGTSSNELATVNGRAVTPPQLSRELDLAVRNQRNQGNDVTQQDAIDAGFHIQLLDSIVSRLALYSLADKLGLSVSDPLVAERIREIPMVQNPITGSFDETAYSTFLQQLGYTQSDFETEFRNDLTSQMLVQALTNGVRAPSSYGALALSFEGETRVVSIAQGASVGAIPAPTEEQVQEFYQEFEERLRVPEFRALTLVVADPGQFAARVQIPEARLREEYDARREALAQPERRTYVRITAASEAQANEIAARLNRGESMAAVARSANTQAVQGDNQSREEVLDAAVAEAVFSMQAGAQARVVRGQLSPFVVVRVNAVTPGRTSSFEEVRDELRQFIARDEAGALLDAAVGQFEDARGAGVPIADAARQAGLQVLVIPATTAEGLDQSGRPIALLEEQAQLLSTAFATAEGEASDFVPVGDADAVIAVDRIIPSTVRPLAEVRDQLVQAWTARERARRLRELGETVVEAVRGGQSFDEAVRRNGMRVAIAGQAMNRELAANSIPANGLPAQIFAANEGDVLTDIRVDGGTVLVALVQDINRVDPSANPQALEAARAQIEQGLSESFFEALQQEIVDRADVRRNEDLLRQFYRTSNAEDAEGEAAQ
jgi:peptidyl-prolyl cis-trans isomerase D